MLRIFTSVKIQRLRPGLNPQTWVPEASMLTTRPSKPSLTEISHKMFIRCACVLLRVDYNMATTWNLRAYVDLIWLWVKS